MTPRLREIIQRHSRPLVPLPTRETPVLVELPGVRAVLFDVYGTLLVSASGELGVAAEALQAEASAAALAAVGFPLPGGGHAVAAGLREAILQDHARAREAGVEHPEVEIREIWRRTLEAAAGQGLLPAAALAADLERLAVEYEVRSNPVWPMPQLTSCLGRLRRAGLRLGIVSNAQFFTPELFPALAGQTLEQLGCDPGLQFYSFRYGRAKPGGFLYDLATRALRQRGIGVDEVLYVGNDMLNDVAPARAAGWRTALFAGDARSLRRREGDPRVRGVSPDLIVNDLNSLCQCLPAAGGSERG